MAQEVVGHVFISYSRTDEKVMRRILEFLRKLGIQVWVDNERLVPGTPVWEAEIEKAIIRANAVVVVLSPDSKESVWVRREISYAERYRKRIFPVLVRGDEDSSISLRLITQQYVDLRDNEATGLPRLSTALLSYLQELQDDAGSTIIEGREKKVQREQIPIPRSTYGVDIEKTSSPLEWNFVLRIMLGWAIAGAIGGAAIGASAFNFLIAGPISGAIGGLMTAFLFRLERILSHWKNLIWLTLVWAIGGLVWAIVLLIGYTNWHLTGFANDVIPGVVAGASGGALGGLILAVLLRFERSLSNWKSMIWTVLGWTIGMAIGGAIAFAIANQMTNANGDNSNWAMRGAFVGAADLAIGSAISILITRWQIKKVNSSTEDN